MTEIIYDPNKNPDMISIWKDTDGNYRGTTQKYGKLVTAREVKPEDVLYKLLHVEGN